MNNPTNQIRCMIIHFRIDVAIGVYGSQASIILNSWIKIVNYAFRCFEDLSNNDTVMGVTKVGITVKDFTNEARN